MSGGHTPGPWRVGSSANGNWIEAGHASQPVSLGRTFYNDVGSDAEDANARVMAAAPELLAICVGILEFSQSGKSFSYPAGSLQLLEVAIAKATRK